MSVYSMGFRHYISLNILYILVVIKMYICLKVI